MVFYFTLAFLCGVALVSQSGINGTLSPHVGGALNAATVSLCVSAVAIVLLRTMTAPDLTFSIALENAPAWSWVGGFCGIFFVAASLFTAQRIGAVALVSCILCGQLTAALVYDQLGILGYGETPLSISRFIGVLLIIAGTLLVLIKR